MKTKTIFTIFILVLLLSNMVLAQLPPEVEEQIPKSYCGDGICGHKETDENCPTDCTCTCRPKSEIDLIVSIEEELTQTEEIDVEFTTREEVPLSESCGVDADLDGILCDPNENFINCPEDCTSPNLDTILCFGEECVWNEAWFVKTLFIIMVGVSMYLLFTDYLSKRRM